MHVESAESVYRRYVQRGNRSDGAVHTAICDAWRAGARDEADARTEGRAAGAREVLDLVDGFGTWTGLADRDAVHFASLAAQIFCTGEPLRRRLAVAWRIVFPAPWWRGWRTGRRAAR